MKSILMFTLLHLLLKESYYYKINEIQKQIPCTKVIYVYQIIPNILRKLRRIVALQHEKEKTVQI